MADNSQTTPPTPHKAEIAEALDRESRDRAGMNKTTPMEPWEIVHWAHDHHAEAAAEILRLRRWLENIVDVYDARSEVFISAEECAVSLAARASLALAGKEYQ